MRGVMNKQRWVIVASRWRYRKNKGVKWWRCKTGDCVSGDEDGAASVARGRIVGDDTPSVRVRTGPGGGPASGAPQAHPSRIQAARAQRIGEHAARQRPDGGAHYPRGPPLQGPRPQLQHRHHIQGRRGNRRRSPHDAGQTNSVSVFKAVFPLKLCMFRVSPTRIVCYSTSLLECMLRRVPRLLVSILHCLNTRLKFRAYQLCDDRQETLGLCRNIAGP